MSNARLEEQLEITIMMKKTLDDLGEQLIETLEKYKMHIEDLKSAGTIQEVLNTLESKYYPITAETFQYAIRTVEDQQERVAHIIQSLEESIEILGDN